MSSGSNLPPTRSTLTARHLVVYGLGVLAHRPCWAGRPAGPRGCTLRGRPC